MVMLFTQNATKRLPQDICFSSETTSNRSVDIMYHVLRLLN